ncbi:MAG: hypothetical protein ACRYG7_37810 [Janthinobacterium lividum]
MTPTSPALPGYPGTRNRPASASPAQPGHTATEKRLLTEIAEELFAFTSGAGWEQQLPFEVSRSFVLERLGNPVQFILKLYQHVSKRSGQQETKLLFDVNITGTGNERWAAANGGFLVSHGSAQHVAAAILAFKTDTSAVQAQLAEHYRGTFYNA